jgi:hypothetical protein
MNVESLLIYGLVAAGGWLLRHAGIGAGVTVPGLSPAAPSVATTLKADIEQIVKSVVESVVKQAIDDIKNAAAPQAPRQTS